MGGYGRSEDWLIRVWVLFFCVAACGYDGVARRSGSTAPRAGFSEQGEGSLSFTDATRA